MYSSLHCIALRTVKYDDRRSIVTAWSAERGRVAFLVPSGASREARRRRALMMPLSLFEGEADIRPGHDLLSLRDVRPSRVLASLSGDPAKAVVAMFLAEVLERVLREAPADSLLTEFIFQSVGALDGLERAVGVANFPLVFLYKLGRFLGIEPDAGLWRPGRIFDLQGGQFRASAPLQGRWIEADEARFVHLLGRLDYSTASRLGIPRGDRRKALDTILEYYSLHYVRLTDLHSLPVVQEIF